MAQAKSLADLIEEAVDNGATTVEEIHKAIADLPLKMLEEIKLLKKPVRQVRKVQDRSIGAVYNLIRAINEQVAELAGKVLKRRGLPGKPRKAPTAAARPARKQG